MTDTYGSREGENDLVFFTSFWRNEFTRTSSLEFQQCVLPLFAWRVTHQRGDVSSCEPALSSSLCLCFRCLCAGQKRSRAYHARKVTAEYGWRMPQEDRLMLRDGNPSGYKISMSLHHSKHRLVAFFKWCAKWIKLDNLGSCLLLATNNVRQHLQDSAAYQECNPRSYNSTPGRSWKKSGFWFYAAPGVKL